MNAEDRQRVADLARERRSLELRARPFNPWALGLATAPRWWEIRRELDRMAAALRRSEGLDL